MEAFQKGRAAAEEALKLDRNLAGASAEIGLVQMAHDWDWAGAEASFKRALALEPGSVPIVLRAADLAIGLGHLEESLVLNRRSVELDPLSAEAQFVLASPLCLRVGSRKLRQLSRKRWNSTRPIQAHGSSSVGSTSRSRVPRRLWLK